MRILDKPVPISRIFLDLKNPRHIELQTEAEAIEYLCDKEEVWALARDITKIGLNPLERIALIPIKGQKNAYVMAEGNRRLCALKLLADPDRAPAKFRKSFASLAKQSIAPQEFYAVEFSDDEEVRPWLERLHNGAYEGRGRRQWNAEQSQRYSGSNKNKVAQGFLDYAVAEGLISEEDRKGKLTTVQRFLGIDVFREAMGLDQSNPDDLARTRPKAVFDAVAKRFIRDLLDTTSDPRPVTSRMNKKDIVAYSRPLGSIPGVTSARIEAEPLSAGGNAASSRKGGKRTSKPRKPEKARHVECADEITSALKSYGNHKLEALYHSICTIELEDHTPLVCIGVWAFFETLTACAGRPNSVAFSSFLDNNRLTKYGYDRNSRTPIRTALDNIQNYGNTTKHAPVAAAFNGDQLNNDVQTLKLVILKCIEEAAGTR